MPDVRIDPSIHAIGRNAWEACAPEALEGFDYLSAVEAAGLAGFVWRYVSVRQDGELICAAPGFLTDYRLDTTLDPAAKRVAAAVRRVLPHAFALKLGAIGSPCTEDSGVIFSPKLLPEYRAAAFRLALEAFDSAARREGCGLVAIKDAPTSEAATWERAAAALGFSEVGGLPSAALDIDFIDIAAYLARLSASTRKDMRRKLKAAEGLHIEVRTQIDDVVGRVHALYEDTRARADMQFEDLTAAYFTGVLATMPNRSLCVLYRDRRDGEILAANLLIHDRQTLLDKFFCMDGERGREHNLYFVSWFTNVRLCLERGLRRYQSGQAGYANKLRLGSRLFGSSMYFRHRNPVINHALGWAAPLLSEKQPVTA